MYLKFFRQTNLKTYTEKPVGKKPADFFYCSGKKSIRFEKNCRECGNAFFLTDRAQLFSSCGFDRDAVDRAYYDSCKGFPHLLDVWGDFRLLEQEHDIGIDKMPALVPYHRDDAFKKNLAVDTFVFIVGVREMLSDVAKRERAEHGVAKRVDEGVAVRMGDAALRVRNGDAAQSEGQTLFEAVDIVA